MMNEHAGEWMNMRIASYHIASYDIASYDMRSRS